MEAPALGLLRLLQETDVEKSSSPRGGKLEPAEPGLSAGKRVSLHLPTGPTFSLPITWLPGKSGSAGWCEACGGCWGPPALAEEPRRVICQDKPKTLGSVELGCGQSTSSPPSPTLALVEFLPVR